MSEGFFSRWSRRKQQEAAGQASEAPLRMAESTESTDAISSSPPAPQSAPTAPTAPTAQAQPEAPRPTLQDAQALTPESDFQPFMQRGVDTGVRNVAMKKLFADPHFNVMDGLDIYIDDYSQPDPLPAGMLRRMASAQFLKLVPEEALERQVGLGQAPEAHPGLQAPGEVVAQSPDSLAMASTTPHDHPDLQLQPDPAPADPPSGSSPR